MGQLPLLPDWDERRIEVQGQRRSEQESPGLDAHDHVDPLSGEPLRQLEDGLAERHRVLQQGRDVFEDDAGLGEVGNVADPLSQVHKPVRMGDALIIQPPWFGVGVALTPQQRVHYHER